MSVQRWRFLDPYDPNPSTNLYTFPINPNAMSSLFGPRKISTAVTTAVDGQALFFEGNPEPVQWTFEGDILDAAHYEALRSWTYERRHRIYLYDHFGREVHCVLQSFEPTPKRSVERYWRHTYVIKAYVIKVGVPTVGLTG